MPYLPTDSHTHTSFSFDSEAPAEIMAQRAVELGIEHYTFTDHLEINMENAVEVAENGAKTIPLLQEKYKDKINLYFGIELGQALHNKVLSEKILADYDFDFVIGSLHNIEGEEDFYFIDYTRIDVDEILRRYFDELLDLAQWDGFDVLGHITYPLRYICGKYGIDVDMTKYSDAVDEIFRTIIRNGKGIEINTSGLFTEIKQTSPDLPLVKRYRELGGEIITIGSDAHYPERVGAGIREAIETARAAGFTKISYFEKRKPKFINI